MNSYFIMSCIVTADRIKKFKYRNKFIDIETEVS